MDNLGDYYNKLNPTFTPQGKGEIVSSVSLPLCIPAGNYRDTSLFPRTFRIASPFNLLATAYSIQIGEETITWPTLLPQNECPLITTRLQDISVDLFDHNHDNLQPVISCEACATCPAFRMCQGTNIASIVSNSEHRGRREASPFRYSDEALTRAIFHKAICSILKKVDWSQLCIPAMQALCHQKEPELTFNKLIVNSDFDRLPAYS